MRPVRFCTVCWITGIRNDDKDKHSLRDEDENGVDKNNAAEGTRGDPGYIDAGVTRKDH